MHAAGPDGDPNDPLNSRGNDSIKVDPPLRKCESTIETRRPPMQVRSRMQPAVNRQPPPSSEPSASDSGLFAPKQVISCIVASENTRAISSAMIALLVVLSYLDCRVFGRNLVSSESIMTSRPLYMLLLTDIIIVLGRLVLEKRRGFMKVGEGEKQAAQEEAQTFAGLVKLLETGFVAHQSLRALFNDFSIYAVVVVCGGSLL